MIRNVSLTSAIVENSADTKKSKMFELNQKYKDCPVTVSEYEIDGKRYIVHSHFVGNKDIDTVIRSIAFRRAIDEILVKTA